MNLRHKYQHYKLECWLKCLYPRYIELTWQDPSQMAMGEYVCEVSIITKKHQTVTVTATLEVTMVTPTINDVVSFGEEEI